MNGIYLASFQAYHPNYKIDYQDINGKRDLSGDMLDIDLNSYDFIIATPPCNYWSRANWRRETSEYSQKTKHLLPSILKKLIDQTKPFIVENVQNKKMYLEHGLYDLPLYVYHVGRHTYWTNIPFNPLNIEQFPDDIHNTSRNQRQGGKNVHKVIDFWIQTIYNNSVEETPLGKGDH